MCTSECTTATRTAPLERGYFGLQGLCPGQRTGILADGRSVAYSGLYTDGWTRACGIRARSDESAIRKYFQMKIFTDFLCTPYAHFTVCVIECKC